jgi:putative ABC transport system substrate-binding protein
MTAAFMTVSPALISIPAIAFRLGLHDLGYVEGQNLTIEERYADLNNALLPDLAAGLLAAGVELIATSASPAAVAAKQATQTVPIVFMEVNDPVGQGLVPSRRNLMSRVTRRSTPRLVGASIPAVGTSGR